MTNDEIARLRALCEEAAPGPWGTALTAALDEIERLRGALWRISIGHHSGTPENDALAWLESDEVPNEIRNRKSSK